MAKRHVRLSHHAQRFIETYLADLGEHNPAAARKILQRFRALRQKIADFPNMAQRGAFTNTRRVVMRPFILTIRLNDDFVEIVAARHERQAEPDHFKDIEPDT
jgi:plasmid stabilization system protein ParE